MDSWWELGEGMGYSGDKLELWRITCAFCGEKGQFSLAYHGEKKKPNSDKRLNFDVYKCSNCGGFVHAFWSASEFASMSGGLYGYKILPWPLVGKPEPSENWPDGMKRFWIQAHDSLGSENWDAAVLMARAALQFVVREKGAKKGNLKSEVEDLAAKNILHPLMAEWSHEIRELANDSAHPEPTAPPPTSEDAKDIVKFLDFLLFYLYDLPKQISDYRTRKNPPSTTTS
jgi:hypothetical protein